jgi:SulP family sulfate permease
MSLFYSVTEVVMPHRAKYGLSAPNKLIAKCEKNQTELILTDIPKQPLSTLAHANIKPIKGVLRFI